METPTLERFVLDNHPKVSDAEFSRLLRYFEPYRFEIEEAMVESTPVEVAKQFPSPDPSIFRPSRQTA